MCNSNLISIPIWFSSGHLCHWSVQVWISYEQHVLFYWRCRSLSFELFCPPSNISESRWAMRWNALLVASGCKSGARASLRLKDTGSRNTKTGWQVFVQYNFPLLLLILQLALCHEVQYGRLYCDQEAQGGGARLPFLHLICYREINMSICSLWWLFTLFCREAICAINLRCFVARPFLSEIYALLSVKFSGLKMCGCKKNDKYEVCTFTF